MSSQSNKVVKNNKQKNNNQLIVRPKNVGLQSSSMVMAPVAKQVMTRMSPPRFSSGSRASSVLRIKHREFVADFSATAAFSVNTTAINPGLSGLFPWLSFMAIGYESYQFNNISFIYEPIVGTDKSGQIMMAIDYDASDSAPLSKQDLLSYSGATCGPLWNAQVCQASRKDEGGLGLRRYIRTGALSANQDVKTYDIGDINIAFQSAATTVVAGALFVEYDVEFFTPQYSMAAIAAAFSCLVIQTSPSKTSLYGTSGTVTGGLDVTGAVNTLTFNKPGQYLVSNVAIGTGLAASWVPTITGTGTVVVKNTTTNTGQTQSMTEYLVTILNKGETFIRDASAVATTVTTFLDRITPYLVALT